MIATTEKIEYGKEIIEFELFQESRKTLSIEVMPTSKIRVKAPDNRNKQEILNKIQNKAKWITKQKQYFIENYKESFEKKYVSGECFKYLGKQYRLKVIKSDIDSVKLKNGYLIVEYNLKTPAKLINKWYQDKSLYIFNRQLDKCYQKFARYNFEKPALKIRKLKKRWGSYSQEKNIITLNSDAIKSCKICIDYILTHELCHCVHFKHNKEFYELLEQIFKNWQNAKKKLESLSL